jgi:hypothetical protein
MGPMVRAKCCRLGTIIADQAMGQAFVCICLEVRGCFWPSMNREIVRGKSDRWGKYSPAVQKVDRELMVFLTGFVMMSNAPL